MTPPMRSVTDGVDDVEARDHNDIKEYIEDGTYRVNTLSLDIGGTEVITSGRAITNATNTNWDNAFSHISTTNNPHSVDLQQAFDDAQTITIADNDNQTLTIANNDVTNNQDTMVINNATTGDTLELNASGNGPHLTLLGDPTVAVPADGDMWYNGTELYFYDGSTSHDLLAPSSVTNPMTLSGDPNISTFNVDGEFGYTGAQLLLKDGTALKEVGRMGTGEAIRRSIQSSSLLNYWKFDEQDTGTSYDYGTGEDNLTGNSISAFVDGVAGGYAVDLDGANDYYSTSTLTPWATDTAGTFSIWAKMDATPANGDRVIWFGRNADTTNTSLGIYYQTADGSFRVVCALDGSEVWKIESGTNTYQPYINDIWVHFVFTHDGTRPRFYINGVEQYKYTVVTDLTAWTKACITDAASPVDRFAIGARFYNSTVVNIHDGPIDEVMYWSGTALSSNEVWKLYASYKPEIEVMKININSGLKSYWTFDEYTATSVTAIPTHGPGPFIINTDDPQTVNYNMNVVSTPPAERGMFGYGPHFDGTADYATATSVAAHANDTQGSFSFWFMLDDDPVAVEVPFSVTDADTNGQTYLQFYCDHNNDRLHTEIYTDTTGQWSGHFGASASFAAYVGQWTHICIVQDGVEPVAYINGVASTITFTVTTDKTKWMKAVITDATNKASNITIGARANNSTHDLFFDGKVDDVRIYNRPLCPEEVMLLFQGYGI